jgi:signal transduction histidine kinase
MRVLLVEDNPVDISLLSALLERAVGTQLLLSTQDTLAAALQACSTETYDAVLMDLDLPDSRGLATLQVFRQRFPDTPLLVLSAAADPQMIAQSVLAGAQDFLLPAELSAPQLGCALRQAIERARLQAELQESEASYRELAQRYEQATRELTERAALRDKLITMIVHDLRTPLSSISLTLEALGDPPRAEALDPLTWQLTREQVEYGFELCSQLLDIRRMQAGQLPLQVLGASVAASINKASTSIQTLAQLREVRLEYSVEPGEWSTDHQLLSRIMLNLLSNAVKYSPRDSTIRVAAAVCDGYLELSVRDEGPGIAPEKQTGIFDMFVSAEAMAPGSGVGLAYCKLACEALGGEIHLISAPGAGTQFVVRLPSLASGAATRSSLASPSRAD